MSTPPTEELQETSAKVRQLLLDMDDPTTEVGGQLQEASRLKAEMSQKYDLLNRALQHLEDSLLERRPDWVYRAPIQVSDRRRVTLTFNDQGFSVEQCTPHYGVYPLLEVGVKTRMALTRSLKTFCFPPDGDRGAG